MRPRAHKTVRFEVLHFPVPLHGQEPASEPVDDGDGVPVWFETEDEARLWLRGFVARNCLDTEGDAVNYWVARVTTQVLSPVHSPRRPRAE